MTNHPTDVGAVHALNQVAQPGQTPDFSSAFFTLSADPMCVLSMDGLVLKTNPAFLNILGYTEAEVAGELIRTFVHPEDLEITREEAQRLFTEGTMVRHENRIRKKNGDYCWLEWTCTLFSYQNTIYVIGKDCTERKAYQQLLEAANKETTTILESITDGFLIMDSNWTVTYWNRQAEILIGVSKSEIIGRSIWDIFPEEIEKTFYKHYHQAFAQQQKVSFEEYLERTGQWLDVTVFPSQQSLTVYFKDVTDRKEREAALSEMNRQLKAITKASFGAIWEFDVASQTYFLHDENFKELFGYDYVNTSMDMQQWIEIVHADDRDRVMKEAVRMVHHGTEFATLNHRFYKADGQIAYVLVRAYLLKDEKGRPSKLIGCIEDITAQKMAELAYITSEEKYKQLFHNTPLPQVIYSLQTFRFVEVNDAAVQHYGYSREEFISMSIYELRPGEEREKLKMYVEQTRQPNVKYVGTWTHLKKSGERITVETTATKIDFEGAECMLVSFNDLTEKLKLEEKLVNLRVAAQKKITKAQIKAQEQQRESIGRELHDNINQLLTTSKLYLDLARANEEMRLDLITRSEGILCDAIQEIRSLSKSLASPVLKDAGFFAAVDDLIDSYQMAQPFVVHANYQNRNAAESLSAEAQLTLYRILQEQLTNIIKYASAKNVWIDFDYLDGNIYLVVKDDGQGFDTGKKRHGVGLNNIKNRLELFNGSMSIESKPGSGCALHVLFPIESSVEAAAESSVSVFIAEDDEDDQYLLQQGFEKVNPSHRLTFAKNGEDLLDALNQLADEDLPQLIILDYSMPGKDGLSTLQTLQVHQRYQSIPKVIYSTSSYEHHKTQCLSAHATAYIEKGLTLEEIEDNVKQILSYCS